MVANHEETVGYDEETVKFNTAIKWVKKSHRLFYKDISERIGLTKEQGEQIRAGKRRASGKDISALIKFFPDSAKFFSSAYTTTEQPNNVTLDLQTLNEPMSTHFYGKQPPRAEPWEELVETQRKVIAMLEKELAAVRERLKVVEIERNSLVEIVTPKK